MRMLFAAAYLVLASVSSPVQADEGWSVYGPGNTACSTWNSNQIAASASARLADMGWLAGFLSGHNLATSGLGMGNKTDDLEFDAFTDWVDTYCQANPLHRVGTAARELAKELLSRRAERD